MRYIIILLFSYVLCYWFNNFLKKKEDFDWNGIKNSLLRNSFLVKKKIFLQFD